MKNAFQKVLRTLSKMVGKKKKGTSANKSTLTAPDVGVYRQLTNFAFAFPVNTLRYKNEYLWPYIRHHLLVQLTAVSIGNGKARNFNPYRLQLGDTSEFNLEKKQDWAVKYGFRFLEDIEHGSVDFLFFTALNASEQVELADGSIYYRVIDPLYEVASEVGTARKVEMIRNISPAVKKCPRYIHQPTFVFSPHIVRKGFSQGWNIKRSFEDAFKKYIPALRYDEERLFELLEWELHTREFYKDLLIRLKPKVIFVPSFHYYAPLISAAKELGVISVDVQHGIQVGYNPLYNDWAEKPEEGYAALPDHFLVWGAKERDNIEAVFGPQSKPHVIGNLWLQRQASLDVELSPALQTALSNGKRIGLMAMQSQTEIPPLFMELIAETRDNVTWLVRMHPKGKKYQRSDFGGAKNVLISNEIDKLPLLPLLKRVDFTLSEGSTIAVEGDTLGVPALIASETGRLNYVSEIEEGRFFYIEKAGDFEAIMMSVERNEDSFSTAPEVDVPAVLAQLRQLHSPDHVENI